MGVMPCLPRPHSPMLRHRDLRRALSAAAMLHPWKGLVQTALGDHLTECLHGVCVWSMEDAPQRVPFLPEYPSRVPAECLVHDAVMASQYCERLPHDTRRAILADVALLAALRGMRPLLSRHFVVDVERNRALVGGTSPGSTPLQDVIRNLDPEFSCILPPGVFACHTDDVISLLISDDAVS